MERRTFVKSGFSAALGLGLTGKLKAVSTQSSMKSRPLLNAYYFRAHMYTMVPRQVREDMKWMADVGTNAVSIAILEQDLFAAVENVRIICEEAANQNMKVFAVPSRWAGMLAGAPKVPSLFSTHHPETWVLNAEGKPVLSSVSGVISSIHYPQVYDFFCRSVDQIFELWPIKGIIWDEPKSFLSDYSAKAVETLGEDAPFDRHIDHVCDFYSRFNTYIKQTHKDKSVHLFGYANWPDNILKKAAAIKSLDYFGCDGRPWREDDISTQNAKGKVLLGENAGERFISAAHQNGKKSLMLIENFSMKGADNHLMDRRLADVLKLNLDQVIYYYYPRNLEKPDENMTIIAKHLRKR